MIGDADARLALQVALLPLLLPTQVQETEVFCAGKEGLVGLAVPLLQKLPFQVVASEL